MLDFLFDFLILCISNVRECINQQSTIIRNFPLNKIFQSSNLHEQTLGLDCFLI